MIVGLKHVEQAKETLVGIMIYHRRRKEQPVGDYRGLYEQVKPQQAQRAGRHEAPITKFLKLYPYTFERSDEREDP